MITAIYKEDFDEGKRKETELAMLLKKNGCKTLKSDDYQDKYEHWDYAFIDIENKFDLKPLSSGANAYRIDVKGIKKLKKSDNDVNPDIHWIEFIGITGKKGWIYGKANYIVFETHKGWIFVDRKKLVVLMEEKTKGKINRSYVSQPYELYKRSGNKDSISYVPVTDLLEITDHILKP